MIGPQAGGGSHGSVQHRRKLGYDLGRVDGFPVLTVGESVTLRGYTITVTGDGGGAHTVNITRDS
ncbi:hypothetical protein [Candidatus Poriferisodalis sp.]|uniref:hypothetical protein n=1 Tax=Candidatus Poriferisodalis sp. TaxID=3101277 RepID=UPI003B024E26